MTRRSTKKAFRRAAEAIRNGNYADAVAVYDGMLTAFDYEFPSLLDHSGVLWGKIEALNAMGDFEAADDLANRAVFLLSVHTMLEAVAA